MATKKGIDSIGIDLSNLALVESSVQAVANEYQLNQEISPEAYDQLLKDINFKAGQDGGKVCTKCGYTKNISTYCPTCYFKKSKDTFDAVAKHYETKKDMNAYRVVHQVCVKYVEPLEELEKVTLKELKQKDSLTEEQLDLEISSSDTISDLAKFFGVHVMLCVLMMGLTDEVAMEELSIEKCLSIWIARRKSQATFRDLLEMLLISKRYETAKQVSMYVSQSSQKLKAEERKRKPKVNSNCVSCTGPNQCNTWSCPCFREGIPCSSNCHCTLGDSCQNPRNGEHAGPVSAGISPLSSRSSEGEEN